MKIGSLQRKVLILLVGGLSIGLTHNPRRQFQVLKQTFRELDKVDKYNLQRAIRNLYKNKLVDFREYPNGVVKLTLSDDGKRKALIYKVDDLSVKVPKKWDRKWRLVIFDIPESFKKARNALRFHLKRLGFYQFQKSAFVLPYPCEGEMEFLIELYGIRPYVRQVVADNIDNQLHLKSIFKLGA